MADLVALATAVETGDRDTAAAITSQALAEDYDPQVILKTMTDMMDVIGGRFSRQEIYVPEMLIAARAMKAAMAVLEPILIGQGHRPEFRAVIGTIRGDLHDIGKNLVAMMWKGANIEVHDLGTNVSPEKFLNAAREHGAQLVGISALLTTTMGGMREVIQLFRAEGMTSKIVVGGAPVTPEWAAEIGADGYAADAASAVVMAKRVLGVLGAMPNA